MTSVVSVLLIFVLSLLCVDPVLQCSPGKGYGRRRPHRKHGPVFYKQTVPNLAETSLGSSGLSEGPIERTSPRFTDLVTNNNPDIVFKDDDENVRLMTQRCRDRVNMLSILVMNYWPGVKLRVIRAWDDSRHSSSSKGSLHQDGRAVDITTSDRDRGKLGTLGGLAVDADFDWVYYETKSHIHCSVKSDSFITAKIGGCFSGHDYVYLENRSQVTLSSLAVGDRILTTDQNGRPVFDQVIGFLHRNPASVAMFIRLKAENRSILLTPDHMILTGKSLQSDDMQAKHASAIEVGNVIYRVEPAEGSSLVAVRVTEVSYTYSRGVYAPLTFQGTIVVGGYAASCYGVISSHSLAHAALWPVRIESAFQQLLPKAWNAWSSWNTENDDGIHWYAALLYRVFVRILPTEYWHTK